MAIFRQSSTPDGAGSLRKAQGAGLFLCSRRLLYLLRAALAFEPVQAVLDCTLSESWI